MTERTWLSVWCEYEGSSYNPPEEDVRPEPFKILVETDDFETAQKLIRGNKELIDDFTQHSIKEPPTQPRECSLQDVMEKLHDIFGEDWAVSHNGQVYSLKSGEIIKEDGTKPD